MAEQHLRDLEHALAQRGWRATDLMETPGDREWGISGTWEIRRGNQSLYIDFDGGDGDGLVTHPVERAYACHVRDRDELGLYFRKRSSPPWRREVDAFVASLDDAAR